MKLGWLPILAVVLHLATLAVAGPSDLVWWTLQIAWQTVGAVGCLAAAAAFSPGDLLWKAWTATGASLLLPTLYRFLTGPGETWPLAQIDGFDTYRLIYLLVVNLFSVAGAVLFVLAFRRASDGFAVSSARRATAIGITAAAALLIGVPTLALDLRDAAGGAETLGAAAPVIADMICFTAVGPLALLARELEGGALQRAWTFLAVYNLGWLLYDVAVTIARVTGQPAAGEMAGELILCAACAVAGSAGFAHRRAMRSVSRRMAGRAALAG